VLATLAVWLIAKVNVEDAATLPVVGSAAA
jgi:hypothetical protein